MNTGMKLQNKRNNILLKVVLPSFFTRRWPTWGKYLATTILMVGLLGIRTMVDPFLFSFPVLVFILGVLICAVLFDHGSGILATIEGALLSAYVSWSSDRLQDHALGLVIAAVIMLLIALFIETLHELVIKLATQKETMERAQEEKDVLIRENAHRVRNDLTTFSSMIRLQQNRLGPGPASQALGALNDRLSVLIRVHNRLRIREGHPSVDSKGFLEDLGSELRESLIGTRPVNLMIQAESHMLSHRTSIALGLILNELLTNALKYAFAERETGDVRVSFWCADDAFHLSVEDDGAGDDGTVKGTGLGQRLIRAMASQIEGTLDFSPSPDGGMRAVLCFPFDAALKTETP
ncbi:MAG: DUF4118 domain-containing protein [Verrucomicrobiaceae bacterium]|nr:MAG: DUF4118 domain-containing protein [Verrucomicrobiaceae bacterium]